MKFCETERLTISLLKLKGILIRLFNVSRQKQNESFYSRHNIFSNEYLYFNYKYYIINLVEK